MSPENKTGGYDATAKIEGHNPDLPIIALTAINREYAFGFSTEDIQADEFLNKPVQTTRLVELIRKSVK